MRKTIKTAPNWPTVLHIYKYYKYVNANKQMPDIKPGIFNGIKNLI